MAWKVAKGISQGTSHIEGNIPCQDYVDCIKLPEYNMILGAVSDGVGSAKRSEIGSKLAVTETLSFLKSWNWNVGVEDENAAREIFHQQVLEIVLTALKQTAENYTCSVHDFACTLLVFVATPKWFIATQVGDGFIVVRLPDGDYELVFKPDKGEFANYTTSITDITPSNVSRKMKVCFKKTHYSFICASTDGLENISLIQQQDYQPYDKFFKPLEDYVVAKDRSEPEDDDELNNFLNSVRVNAKTEDDKTLLLCAYDEELSHKKPSVEPILSPSIEEHRDDAVGTPSLTNESLHSRLPVTQPPKSKEFTDRDLEIAIEERLNNIDPDALISTVRVKGTTLEVTLESDNKPAPKTVIELILEEINRLRKKTTKINKLEVYNPSRNGNYLHWQQVVKIRKKNLFSRTVNIPVIVFFSMSIALILALIGILKIIDMRIFIYCICLLFCIFIIYTLYLYRQKKRSE